MQAVILSAGQGRRLLPLTADRPKCLVDLHGKTLLQWQLDALLADKAKLTAVLTYHVVPGKVMAKDVKAGKVKTVQGSELTLGTTGGVTVDAAKVVKADIVASNGVIHVIDSVVLPK